MHRDEQHRSGGEKKTVDVAWPCPSHEERPASARGAVLGAPWEEAPGQTTRHLAEDHRGRDENSWKDVE